MISESLYLNKNIESHYINSFLKYNNSQCGRPFTLLFNPLVGGSKKTLKYDKSRAFSFSADTVEINANNNIASASKGKLSISSLDQSMTGHLAEILRHIRNMNDIICIKNTSFSNSSPNSSATPTCTIKDQLCNCLTPQA